MKPTVLVVEDEDKLRRVIELQLKSAGYDVLQSATAEDARQRTTQLPSPTAESMFTHVYTDAHPLMAEQRAWLADYEASFEEGRA